MLWFLKNVKFYEPTSLKVKESVICEFEMYFNTMMTKFLSCVNINN